MSTPPLPRILMQKPAQDSVEGDQDIAPTRHLLLQEFNLWATHNVLVWSSATRPQRRCHYVVAQRCIPPGNEGPRDIPPDGNAESATEWEKKLEDLL